jgi:hypothetical protein
LGLIIKIVIVPLGVSLAAILLLSLVLVWQDQKTLGLAYYGRSRAERAGFKRTLKRWAVLLHPIIILQAKLVTVTFEKARFLFRGVAGPRGTCDESSFERAAFYEPDSADIFVVTQMKCGTTWMQHIVYEVLSRGRGNLVDDDQTLYAVSPWLEGLRSVPIEEAPLIGAERPSRIIKTHLPVSLCPFSPEARYIYVVRHPVSCLASCADFIRASLGRFTPELKDIVQWFRSEENMWWGVWPSHVAGWWGRSQQQSNVLFLRFEDLKADLPGAVARVADFLGIAPLNEQEMGQVVTKCGFDYMKRHGDTFEMAPPHILSVDAEIFVSGKVDRNKDLPEAIGREVREWCGKSLQDNGLSALELYPDLKSG